MSLHESEIRFLLVNPTASPWRVKKGDKPSRATKVFRFSMLTSLSVAAAAPPWVRTRIVDEDVEPLDFDVSADLVGISCMTFNAPRAYEIAARFRERGTRVILGGYHPTFMPEEALLHANAVCVGEAETVLPRMMEDFAGGRLRGVYRGEVTNLKDLRRPDRSLISEGAYPRAEPIQATRGCPNTCRFCSVSTFFRNTFRARPVDDVVEELGGLGRFILFLDDNLTADPEYARELFSRMIPLRKMWFSQASVDIASDPELVQLAAASGCRGLFLGLESVCQESLAGWDKGSNIASDYKRAIGSIHDRGIAVLAAVVFGSDEDTPGIFHKTLSFLQEARVDALQATILTPFPGTPLFSQLEEQGRIIDRDWSKYDFANVVFRPAGMSENALRQGQQRVLTRFYSRSRIFGRVLGQMGYLSPSTMLTATVPVNISYRRRLTANQTLL